MVISLDIQWFMLLIFNDWCCLYYLICMRLVALLGALCARSCVCWELWVLGALCARQENEYWVESQSLYMSRQRTKDVGTAPQDRDTLHDSFICETWLLHLWDMTHSYVRHDPFICETWLFHAWDLTHSYMGHDSFMCETDSIICKRQILRLWNMTPSATRDTLICWNMTSSSVRHDSFVCETWLIYPCDMTHSYVRYDIFISGPWLVHLWDTTPAHVWHEWSTRKKSKVCILCEWACREVQKETFAHMNESCLANE